MTSFVKQEHVLAEIKRDYTAMQIMIYGEVPLFDEILQVLGELEREINTQGEQRA